MTAQLQKMYSEQEYLELEREAAYKSEYYRGEIFAMSGAGYNHNRIVENLSGEFYIRFKGKSCHTFSSDMRMHIPANTLYTYPDLMVVCGKDELLDNRKDTLLNPVVIIEVLSPSTSGYDRGAKFHLYRSISSLQEYVLINSLAVAAEVFRKNDLGAWSLASEAYALQDSIEMSSIGVTLSLSDVYGGVDEL